jgi:hypothetical protein
MLKSRLIPKQTGLAGLQGSGSQAFDKGKQQRRIRMKNADFGKTCAERRWTLHVSSLNRQGRKIPD